MDWELDREKLEAMGKATDELLEDAATDEFMWQAFWEELGRAGTAGKLRVETALWLPGCRAYRRQLPDGTTELWTESRANGYRLDAWELHQSMAPDVG